MKIKYEIDLSDCLALNDHLLKASPLIRKTIRKGQIWWASGPLIGGIFIVSIKNIPPEKAWIVLLVLGLALSLPMFFLYPLYFKNCTRKHTKKLCEGDNSKGVQGQHEIELTDDWLIEKTEYNETKHQWQSIIKIDSTTDHTFAYVSENVAHIIPKDKIIEGNYSLFVERLTTIFEKAQANQKMKVDGK